MEMAYEQLSLVFHNVNLVTGYFKIIQNSTYYTIQSDAMN